MKKLILLSVLTLSLIGCSNDDKADQFCGTVIGAGHSMNTDVITISNGKETKNFNVPDLNKYPLHSYQCK